MTGVSLSRRPLVLHLSADYPDANRQDTTVAVRAFIKACEGLDHFVVSLNRVAQPWRVNCVDGDGLGDRCVVSMRYWGLPGGIGLGLSMWIVARRVRRLLLQRSLNVDLIHAHKLSFEGLSAWWLARWLKVPFVVSIRGEAESKIFRFKPVYRFWLSRVVKDARRIYYVSAWFRPALRRCCRPDPDKECLLPNFVAERPCAPTQAGEAAETAQTAQTAQTATWRRDHVVTVMDLNVYRKKGLDRLLPAFKAVLADHPQARLDVIGRGQPDVLAEIAGQIAHLGLQSHVRLLGAFANAELLLRLPGYAALALPSHNETFGMVYVEALLAGLPILYSRGTGIDGFVDDVPEAVAVDPRRVASVADGLRALLSRQAALRQGLAARRAGILQRFSAAGHVAKYQDAVALNARECA